MILGTGHGASVGPLTLNVPRPMIPLVRKPVMESVVALLVRHGVSEIVVSTSELAPAIEQYFRDGERHGAQMAYSFEGRLVDAQLVGDPLGSAGGLKRVQGFSGFFDETFVVMPGDAVSDVDLTQAERLHVARGALATVVQRESGEDGGEARSTGIFILEPEVLDWVPAGEPFDIETELLPLLEAEARAVQRVTLPFQHVEIASMADYWHATQLVLRGDVAGYHVPGREVRAGVHLGINVAVDLANLDVVGPVYIGSGTSIEPGARLVGPSLVGSNCVVESGAVVERCILDDYTRVASVANLRDKIVLGGHCIDPDGMAIDIAEADIGWLLDDARREGGLDEWQQALVDLAAGARR